MPGPGAQPAVAADGPGPGRAGTLTHDYKRHGTTTLVAALNVLTGEVLSKCQPRHRNGEFLTFLRLIDRTVPKDQQVHLICDNYDPKPYVWTKTADVHSIRWYQRDPARHHRQDLRVVTWRRERAQTTPGYVCFQPG